MARKDVEQFNLRLNLNNPNHLKIYRTFQDLNTDIHKSRNNFIIEALLRYINGISDEDLTFTGAKKKQEADRYVTQSEIAELETRITAKVMKEVAEMMGRAAEAPKENETKDVIEEEDATLQEMSLMFAQGEFGKE